LPGGEGRPPNYGDYLAAVQEYDVSYRAPLPNEESENTKDQKQVRIVAMFANPPNSGRLKLASEERVIRECLRLSRFRDNLKLFTCPAATVRDLRRALLDEEPDILQFSGHGTPGGLIFEKENGEAYVPGIDAMRDLLVDFAPPLRCAIFNACYSAEQGAILEATLPFTIMSQHALLDEAAIEFSRGFYDALGAGRDILFAYKQGCNSVRLEGYPLSECPSLIATDHAL
jgi:hypothetical protein